MKKQWYMLTLIGADRSGIVAQITNALFDGGCNLGEASMMRLGGNFTVMMMVDSALAKEDLQQLVKPIANELGLTTHLDMVAAELHHHLEPDLQISVYGADRTGIVARVTGGLADAGFNILDMQTDVGGSPDDPIYIMQMEGSATQGVLKVKSIVDSLKQEGVDVQINEIETLIG
jgi:glycine cleavage system transcriptional repressor